jgi:hypothetical protein
VVSALIGTSSRRLITSRSTPAMQGEGAARGLADIFHRAVHRGGCSSWRRKHKPWCVNYPADSSKPTAGRNMKMDNRCKRQTSARRAPAGATISGVKARLTLLWLLDSICGYRPEGLRPLRGPRKTATAIRVRDVRALYPSPTAANRGEARKAINARLAEAIRGNDPRWRAALRRWCKAAGS